MVHGESLQQMSEETSRPKPQKMPQQLNYHWNHNSQNQEKKTCWVPAKIKHWHSNQHFPTRQKNIQDINYLPITETQQGKLNNMEVKQHTFKSPMEKIKCKFGNKKVSMLYHVNTPKAVIQKKLRCWNEHFSRKEINEMNGSMKKLEMQKEGRFQH